VRKSKPRPVTIELVLDALKRAGPGWHLASDLPIKGSFQAIGSALRHARRQGVVQSRFENASANRSEWRLKP